MPNRVAGSFSPPAPHKLASGSAPGGSQKLPGRSRGHLRSPCLKYPDRTESRQVAFFLGRAKTRRESYTDKMKRKIDSAYGRFIYGQRLGTVEPVFANICSNKGMNRFTLRGKIKVTGQWLMYCIVHNIEKIANYAPSFA